MSNKDTDIRERDGLICRGSIIGHADEQSRIRGKDGLIFRGEELGYVDDQGKVRCPDGLVFRGEVVGQIKNGNRAHDEDGIILPGEEWGYVDQDGNIRQKDGLIFRGRIIGKMRGKDRAAALAYFILRFKQMEDGFEQLSQMVRSAPNKTPFLGKVQHMLNYVPNADALGDFEGLMSRLKQLEQEIVAELSNNRWKKEAIVKEAETLSYSNDWKAAGERFKELRESWKSIRSAGRDHEEALWQRFRAAQDRFYRRRSEHFEKEMRIKQENLIRKEKLCSTAESLSRADDHRAAMVRVKELQAEWKTIGPVPKEQQEALWTRFRRACDEVFQNARKEHERKAAEWEKRNRERMDNLHKKEIICGQAEALAASGEGRAAAARVKELQADWKSVGPVPKEQADRLWDRFRRACDRVFQNAAAERDRKQEEWRRKMEETLSHKREQADRLNDSIAHDEANIGRWQDTIYGLRDGGRAEEIRSSLERKISDVESRIRSKRDRVRDLERVINDIERKLC